MASGDVAVEITGRPLEIDRKVTISGTGSSVTFNVTDTFTVEGATSTPNQGVIFKVIKTWPAITGDPSVISLPALPDQRKRFTLRIVEE